MSTFHSITLLEDMVEKHKKSLGFPFVDLLLCHPYLGDYSDI